MRKFFDAVTTNRYAENRQLLSFASGDFLASKFDNAFFQYVDPLLQGRQLSKLLQLVQTIFKYHDFQADNPYKFHKLIPSARNVHPEIPYVMIFGKAFRYDAIFNRFIYCGEVQYSKDFQLVIALDVGRLCMEYGTFGVVLSLLDLGHIIAEFERIAVDEKSGVEIAYMFDREEVKQQLHTDDDIFFGSVIRISNKQLASETMQFKSQNEVLGKNRKLIDYSRELSLLGVTKYLHSFTKIPEFQRKGEQLASSGDLSRISTGRTSANSSTGLTDLGVHIPAKKWRELLKASTQIMKRYQDKGNFTLHILVRNQGTEIDGYYCIGKQVTKSDQISIDFDEVLHDSKEFFNLEDASYVSFVTYRDSLISVQEQIYYSHVFSAEIIHHLSEFFTTKGYYTRPMKNFDDAYLKQKFIIHAQERVIYMLLAGNAVTSNFKYVLER